MYQLMGTCDGLVRVQPLAAPKGQPLGPYWEGSIHDVHVSVCV